MKLIFDAISVITANKRRRALVTLGSLLLWLAFSSHTVPVSATTVSIPESSGPPGATVTIPIRVDDATGIAGIEIILTFNPDLLASVETQTATLTSDFLIADSITQGETSISLACARGITGGSGSIAEITFKVDSTATPGSSCPLAFNKVSLYDENTESIPATSKDGTFTVTPADVIPPSVISTFPQQDALDVPINIRTIAAFFSEPINGATVSSTSMFVTVGGQEVEGVVSYSSDSKVAIFTPNSDLEKNAVYAVVLTDKITDPAENPLRGGYSWTFTTGGRSDTAPPQVTATSPLHLTINVPINIQIISAVFSEQIDVTSLHPSSMYLTPLGDVTKISSLVAYIGLSQQAIFIPLESLEPFTTYKATITTEVKDAAANPLAADYNWQFTTGEQPDTTPPTVDPVTPKEGATDVPVQTLVTAAFNEVMDVRTLTSENIKVESVAGVEVAGRILYDGVNNEVVFIPYENLSEGTTYRVTLTRGITDIAGNALVADRVWSFTTIPPFKKIVIRNAYNYPNPFNPEKEPTTFKYTLIGGNAKVTIKIFDLNGTLIRTVVEDAEKYPGVNVENGQPDVWDGSDQWDDPVGFGSYIYKITAVDVEDQNNNDEIVQVLVVMK